MTGLNANWALTYLVNVNGLVFRPIGSSRVTFFRLLLPSDVPSGLCSTLARNDSVAIDPKRKSHLYKVEQGRHREQRHYKKSAVKGIAGKVAIPGQNVFLGGY